MLLTVGRPAALMVLLELARVGSGFAYAAEFEVEASSPPGRSVMVLVRGLPQPTKGAFALCQSGDVASVTLLVPSVDQNRRIQKRWGSVSMLHAPAHVGSATGTCSYEVDGRDVSVHFVVTRPAVEGDEGPFFVAVEREQGAE